MAVYEETGKMIGQRVLPLDGLQAGYRHISLRTEGNFPLSLPTIFCEIILKSYVPDGLTDFVDQLNKPLLMKKAEESLSASAMNSSESNLTSSSSSIRRNRILTDTASAPNPTLDTRITSTGASNSSVNTLSTMDGASSASSLPKAKTPAEHVVPVTLEYLREHKNFLKLQHKQEKELILIKKKQSKEQTILCEQQSKLMSKAKTETEKTVRSPMAPSSNQRKEFRYVLVDVSHRLVLFVCPSFLVLSLKLLRYF
jgi:phosphatidylinositol phospholipase C, beta